MIGHALELASNEPVGVLAALRDSRERLSIEDAHQARLIARFADMASTPIYIGTGIPGEEHLNERGADGTPAIAEFAAREIGFALRISPTAASRRLVAVVNLQHRFPRLWRSVASAEVPLWRATQITEWSAGLSRDEARWVDSELEGIVPGLGPVRLKRLVAGLVASANPELLAERERRGLAQHGVLMLLAQSDGTQDIHATLGLADARALDHTLDQIAETLRVQGSTDDHQQRRAKALAALAVPSRAQELLDGLPATSKRHLSRATLYVHLAADSLSRCSGGGEQVARLEQLHPSAASNLHTLLADCHVTVRPVIDLNAVTPVDAYEIPNRLREAVVLAKPVDMFPYSSGSARRGDLDHIDPYQRTGAPGQTSMENLAPLSRSSHRAKTHAGWRSRTSQDGHLEWRSPHGQQITVTGSGLSAPRGAIIRQQRSTSPPGQPSSLQLVPDIQWHQLDLGDFFDAA